MTMSSPITRFGATEALSAEHYPRDADSSPITPVFRDFALLVSQVGEAIDLERELAAPLSWDPACSGWPETAERTWVECGTLARDIYEQAATHPFDLPLQRAAMLLHFLIEAETPEEFARLQDSRDRHADMFRGFEDSSNALLDAAMRQVDHLAELSRNDKERTDAALTLTAAI